MVIVVLVGVSVYSLAGSLSGASASTAAQDGQPSGYPACSYLDREVSGQGYTVRSFVSSTTAKLGSIVCVNVILLNIDGRNLTLGSDAGWGISFNITESSGAVAYHRTCTPVSSASVSNFTRNLPILSWTCGTFWYTGQAYNGTIALPGTYSLQVRALVPEVAGQGLSLVTSTARISLVN